MVDPLLAPLMAAGAAEIVDLKLHQALQGHLRHVAQEPAVVGLLQQLLKCHALVGHRVQLRLGLRVATQPYRKNAMTTALRHARRRAPLIAELRPPPRSGNRFTPRQRTLPRLSSHRVGSTISTVQGKDKLMKIGAPRRTAPLSRSGGQHVRPPRWCCDGGHLPPSPPNHARRR
jgi:hypothetical protein